VAFYADTRRSVSRGSARVNSEAAEHFPATGIDSETDTFQNKSFAYGGFHDEVSRHEERGQEETAEVD
jgi:hypothetical protein